MGWNWMHRRSSQSAKEFITNLLTSETSEVLGISIHNSVGYAAVKNKALNKTEALVILLRQDSTLLYNQGFKLVWEEEGPFHTDCPFYILALLSDTADYRSNEWRLACREKRNPNYIHPGVQV